MNPKWKLWIARKILKLRYDIEIDGSIVARGKESGNITMNGETPGDCDSITIIGGLDLRNDCYYYYLKHRGIAHTEEWKTNVIMGWRP